MSCLTVPKQQARIKYLLKIWNFQTELGALPHFFAKRRLRALDLFPDAIVLDERGIPN